MNTVTSAGHPARPHYPTHSVFLPLAALSLVFAGMTWPLRRRTGYLPVAEARALLVSLRELHAAAAPPTLTTLRQAELVADLSAVGRRSAWLGRGRAAASDVRLAAARRQLEEIQQ